MHHKVYQKTLHCTTPHSYFLADSLWRKWTRFLWPSGIYTVIKYFTHSPRPRPKSGNDERILQIALDGTQGIAHAKAKVSNAHWRGPTFEMCGWKYCIIAILHGRHRSAVRSDGGSGQRERSVHFRVYRQRGVHRQPTQEEGVQETHGSGECSNVLIWAWSKINWLLSPVLSARGWARPKEDQRHVPVLWGRQQDPLLSPLGPCLKIVMLVGCSVKCSWFSFFRSPGFTAPWTKGRWDPGALGLFPDFKNWTKFLNLMQNQCSAREQCERCLNESVKINVKSVLKPVKCQSENLLLKTTLSGGRVGGHITGIE